MHGPRRFLIPIIIILALAAVGIWYMFQVRQAQGSARLEASGSVEVVDVAVAPETGGQVAQVLVQEGDTVQAGDVLFRLDDELLMAQKDRASAALESTRAAQTSAQSALEMAKAGLETARAGVEAAQVQVEVAFTE